MVARILRSNLYHKWKRKALQQVWLVRLGFVLGVCIMVMGIGWLLAKPLQLLAMRIWKGPQLITTFFSDPLYTLPSYEGRTNILFLGKGGKDHEGGDLADTIIFVSADLKNTAVTMLSIPRDIWVPSLDAKINAAYMLGEQQATGSGYTLMEDAVYEITNQPLHYVVSLDFDGFVQVVDALGGIEVAVDRTFTDTEYPIKGKELDDCGGDPLYRCRYETLTFKKGLQSMDGVTALKFARSRHSEGEDGNDFARSERQQKVIAALKQKLLSPNVLLNPQKLFELKALAQRYILVDRPISDTEYAAFAGFGLAFWRSGKEIKTITLDIGDEERPGFLINPPIEKYEQWVLEPRLGTWQEFQEYFREVLREQ